MTKSFSFWPPDGFELVILTEPSETVQWFYNWVGGLIEKGLFNLHSTRYERPTETTIEKTKKQDYPM